MRIMIFIMLALLFDKLEIYPKHWGWAILLIIAGTLCFAQDMLEIFG